MQRRLRTELLIRSSDELLRRLADQVTSQFQAELVQEPKEILVMLKVRESAKNSLFYLGEICATETKVLIQGVLGLGLIVGTDFERSYQLAIVDAAFNASLPMVETWSADFEAAQKKQQVEYRRASSRVAATRVSFESMDQADQVDQVGEEE